jgi:hypothetical protein
MNGIAKALLRPLAETALQVRGRLHARGGDLRDTIVVAAAGRGGSTWLAEILAAPPGRVIVWEPLHLETNPHCRAHGFDWNTYLRAGAEDPVKQAYLGRILTGAALCSHLVSWPHVDAARLLHCRGLVVKFTNANLLLHWMLERFPVRAVLLLRHPCAVVSSQLRHGAWSHVGPHNLTVPAALAADYPHLAALRAALATREEALAFEWAMQTVVPLSQPRPHRWYLAIYERLVADGPAELGRVFAFLGEPVRAEALRRLGTPSATAPADTNSTRGAERLDDWRRHLSTEQARRVLAVVREAGIDFYDERPTPDESKLAAWD